MLSKTGLPLATIVIQDLPLFQSIHWNCKLVACSLGSTTLFFPIALPMSLSAQGQKTSWEPWLPATTVSLDKSLLGVDFQAAWSWQSLD